ncbi:hypothetical protein QR680_014989 [Steinernema hermaphroditum]|uniref:Peptidase S1 domain-containing protein n=1 Tax=Steinernema hermaphroditum TaxID=289476 RepID=A0AA39IDC8_9BILA|nr:hypothetical protein QR680_014989 [Steinernema hermaphroditum]
MKLFVLLLLLGAAHSLPANLTSNSVNKGERARDGQFPYMVMISTYDANAPGYFKYDCTGVAITGRHVLTHAMCGYFVSDQELKVVMPEVNEMRYVIGRTYLRVQDGASIKGLYLMYSLVVYEVDWSFDYISPIQFIPTNDEELMKWSDLRTVDYGPVQPGGEAGNLNWDASFVFDANRCTSKSSNFTPKYGICAAGKNMIRPIVSQRDNGAALIALHRNCGSGCLVGVAAYNPLVEGNALPIEYIFVRASKFCAQLESVTNSEFKCSHVKTEDTGPV